MGGFRQPKPRQSQLSTDYQFKHLVLKLFNPFILLTSKKTDQKWLNKKTLFLRALVPSWLP